MLARSPEPQFVRMWTCVAAVTVTSLCTKSKDRSKQQQYSLEWNMTTAQVVYDSSVYSNITEHPRQILEVLGFVSLVKSVCKRQSCGQESEWGRAPLSAGKRKTSRKYCRPPPPTYRHGSLRPLSHLTETNPRFSLTFVIVPLP